MAFFPIYDHDYVGDRLPSSKQWPITEEQQPQIAEDAVFTLQTLAHLAEHHKVQSSTARLFSRPQKDVVLSDYICFPWLVVEHKKAVKGKDREQCYCQAANAGTAAVMMLESLCRIQKGHGPDNDHILPVVTMTTVDKIVKIWIAYSCKPSDDAAAKYVRPRLPAPLVPDCYSLLACLWKTSTLLTSMLRDWTASGKET